MRQLAHPYYNYYSSSIVIPVVIIKKIGFSRILEVLGEFYIVLVSYSTVAVCITFCICAAVELSIAIYVCDCILFIILVVIID